METHDKIFIAGHRGLVGSAILRRLRAAGFANLITRTHKRLDLENQSSVLRFFKKERPAYVVLAAAKVGGILANDTCPADFIGRNLRLQTNVIDAALQAGTRKLLFLGSSCIYPRECPQPISESHLLTGPLEKTNEWYAIAKIAGIKLCQAYRRQFGFGAICAMPTNLYGPGDNFDDDSSHVLPALLRRFHEARREGRDEAIVWGSGRPRREFLHVDDLADACLFLMQHYDDEQIINVGTGKDMSISELAELIRDIVGFKGKIRFDPSRPDGTPRKVLDVSRMSKLGWRSSISVREGILSTYRWAVQNVFR